MKKGDRVEIKVTGGQGVLVDVVRYNSSFIVRLDSGEEVRMSRLEIRGLQNKEEKRKKLLQMVRKGGGGIAEPWVDMDKRFGDLFPSDESEGRDVVTVGVAKEKMSKKELGDLVFAIRSELNEHLFVGEDCEAFTMLDELQEEIDKLDIE